MVVVRASEVKPYVSPLPHKRELRVLLSPRIHHTSNLLGMGMVTIQPGESGNPHNHEKEQETWFVISGEGKLVIGKEEVHLEPDMLVVAPAGIPHQIFNDGSNVLKALFIFTPAGPEEPHFLETVENAVAGDNNHVLS